MCLSENGKSNRRVYIERERDKLLLVFFSYKEETGSIGERGYLGRNLDSR